MVRKTQLVKHLALKAGFARVGVAPPALDARASRLNDWLARGYHAGMSWMARTKAPRLAPEVLLPGCRALIALSVPYDSPAPLRSELAPTPGRGWISRHAWGQDYHFVLRAMLCQFEKLLRVSFGAGVKFVGHVDSGPVMERIVASSAGLGWIGKNCCLIDGARGSFHFLAVVLTDLALQPDAPTSPRCGDCRLCLDACPTGALLAPGWIDARRCLSYLTVEHKGAFDSGSPVDELIATGAVFGCDRCQDVCPYNELARRRRVFGSTAFLPREGLFNPSLDELASLGRGQFRRRFKGSPLYRLGVSRLRRTLIPHLHRHSRADSGPTAASPAPNRCST